MTAIDNKLERFSLAWIFRLAYYFASYVGAYRSGDTVVSLLHYQKLSGLAKMTFMGRTHYLIFKDKKVFMKYILILFQQNNILSKAQYDTLFQAVIYVRS